MILLLMLGGVAGLSPAQAFAQDEAALSEARSKFQRAIELKQAKNCGGALKLFREVGSVKMTPQVRYHIASCEERLGQLVTALGGYQLALATGDDLPPQFREEVQQAIDDLEARIPRLVLERGHGADAATIRLDGVALGASSIGTPMPLDPGPHAVQASAPGFEPFRETVTVEEGEIESLTIHLSDSSAAAKDAGEPSLASSAQTDEPASFGALPYVLGGAGLAIAAAGGVFLGLSQAKAGQTEELCGGTDCTGLTGADLQEARDLAEGATSFETIGWVGVGVGAAAVVAGTTLFFVDRGRRERSPVETAWQWRPAAPHSDLGFSLTRSF